MCKHELLLAGSVPERDGKPVARNARGPMDGRGWIMAKARSSSGILKTERGFSLIKL